MKTPKFLAFLGALAAFHAAPVQGQAVRRDDRPNPIIVSTRLQLSVEMDPGSARIGSPIFVKLRLKAVSAKPVTFTFTGVERDFALVVTDATGKELPKTDYAEREDRRGILLHSDGGILQPGQEFATNLELTKLYRVTQAGTYYARVVFLGADVEAEDLRKAPEGSPRPVERVYSNPVQFTVVP